MIDQGASGNNLGWRSVATRVIIDVGKDSKLSRALCSSMMGENPAGKELHDMVISLEIQGGDEQTVRALLVAYIGLEAVQNSSLPSVKFCFAGSDLERSIEPIELLRLLLRIRSER
jgi:hypothetical protein